RALRDDLTAVHAGARTHVDDVVGREDGLAIVLDDDDGVAEVTKTRLRLDEARVVARVQADARLVEHVEHADQGRPDLRREPDALPFARRERLRAAIEREVVEPDVDEEPEARRDRLQQRFRDGALARAEEGRAGPDLTVTMGGAVARGGSERLDEAPDVPERHRPDLRHVLAAELHREGFGAEALAFAGVARARHEEAPELFVGDSALAPPAPDLGLRFGSGLGPRCAGTKAVEDRLALRLGQLDPGGVGVDAEGL